MNRSDFSEMNRNRMRKMLLTQTDADRPNSVLNTIVRNMLKEFEQRPVTRSSIRKSASSSNIPPVTSAVTVEECMDLLTRSSNTDFNDILSGCTIYCDIMMEKYDRSFAVKIMLQTMGATISNELNDTVTHVIFRNGSKKTLDLAKKLHISVVSILWLEAVRRTKHKVPESLYEPIEGMTKDVIDVDQFCHSIEEEYKHVVNEEVSQLNKSIASKENAPNCKEIFQSGDEIEIEFQSNVLHKTIFDELNRSASRLSKSENNLPRKCTKRKLDFGEPNPEHLDESIAESNLDKSKKNDDSVVNGNVTMQQSVTTTTKKKMRKLYTPGPHNFETHMLDTPATTVQNTNVVSSKKTYVPPYIPKLTNYKFPSLRRVRPQPDEEPTRRPEALRKITKPRKVLKDILANISSESGSVKSSPNTRISSSSKKKPPNKTVSKLNGGLRSIGKKTDCTYDTNTCGHRSSDFMTPETINITVNKSAEKDRKVKKIESIVVTNLPREQTVDVIKAVKILGHYQYENNVSDKTTHIITTGQRTKNLLLGFINGCWILNFKWIEESLKANKWLAEDEFEMVDVNTAFRKRRIDRQLLGEPHNMNLFKNYKIFLGNFKTDSFRDDLKMLINKCGEGCLVDSPFDASVIIGKCDTTIKKATYVLESWVFDSIMASKTMLIRRMYLQKKL